MIDMAATEKNIKRLMEERGMVVKDLQMLFGFGTPQSVYKWISGKSIPCIDNLVELAEIFGVKIDDIVIRG